MKNGEKIRSLPHISQVILGICSGIIIGISIRLWIGSVFDYLVFFWWNYFSYSFTIFLQKLASMDYFCNDLWIDLWFFSHK